MNHLQPTESSAIKLLQHANGKPFVMLNLIQLKKTADYSSTVLQGTHFDKCANTAFNNYVTETEPFLAASGGRLILQADASNYFVGPGDVVWDKVMLIEQRSVADFFAFAQNKEYLAVLAHREAPVEDSRLLPLFPDV